MGLRQIIVILSLLIGLNLNSQLSKVQNVLQILNLDDKHYSDSVYIKEIDNNKLFKDFPWLSSILNDKINFSDHNITEFTTNEYIELKMIYYKSIERYIISIKLGVRGPLGGMGYYSPIEHGKYFYFKFNNQIILFSNNIVDTTINANYYKETGDSMKVNIEFPMPDDRIQWNYSFDIGDERPYLISTFQN